MASANLPFWQINPSAEPPFEGFRQRSAFLLLGAAATDVLLDGIGPADMLEPSVRNGRGTGGGEFVEVTPHMRPAECKLHVAALGEPAIVWIARTPMSAF